jgi:hypothetical protein
MNPRRVLLLALVIALGSCTEPGGITGFDDDGATGRPDALTALLHGVAIGTHRDGIVIRNGGSVPVYYFAADRAILPLINWGACSDPATCVGVVPGSTVVVPGSSVAGWGTSNEVVVYWWRLVPAAEGGYTPDRLRAVTLTL